MRLERVQPFIDIEINLVGKATRNTALTEFALRIDVGVKLIGIARKVGVVTNLLRLVLFTARPRTRDDRLQLADLALRESVGSLPKSVREAAGEGQFVKRVDPVRPQIVELPIGVDVRLLERVVGPHALVDRHDVGLRIREVI